MTNASPHTDKIAEPTPDELRAENKALEGALTLAQRRLFAMRDVATSLMGRLDLDHLLDDILAHVSAICECERASLFMLDAERNELWSRVAEGVGKERGEIRFPATNGIAGHVVQTGDVLNLSDAYADARFNRQVDEDTGYKTRTLLCIPLRGRDGTPIGVLEALNKRGDGATFNHDDERLLEAISTQVSVAITDALLFEELAEKARSLAQAEADLFRRSTERDLLIDIEREMNSATDSASLLNIITERLLLATDSGAAAIALKNQKTGGLVVTAAAGGAADALKTRLMDPTQGLLAAAIDTNRTVRTDDAENDPRHDSILADEVGYRVGPLLAVPIANGQRMLGGLEVMREPGAAPFTPGDETLLKLIAARAAGALVQVETREKAQRDEQLQTVGRMLAGIVHDFKTPMTVISGYVQLMAMEDEDKERERCADIVLKQTEQMTAMTKELLQFAKGESEVLVRKVYMQRFAQEVDEMLQALFKETPHTLKVNVTYRGAARFDEIKVKRALANLAKNAVEAMGESAGTFSLTISQEGDQVEFAAQDTGPGLAPEIQSRLFESFATYGKEGGTGLGLALVKKIAHDHHGEVRVESVPGEGATFRLRLPL